MQLVKSFLRYLVLIIVILLTTYYTSDFFTQFADKYFGLNLAGGWIDISFMLGLFLGLNFSVSFIFTLLGGKKKYTVLSFFLVPLLFFEIIDGDFKLFGCAVLLSAIGWVLGVGILKLSRRLLKSVRSK